MQDEFRDGASGGIALLETVPGEAVGEVEVGDLGMRADDRVLVERVVVVEAGPGADNFASSKAGTRAASAGQTMSSNGA